MNERHSRNAHSGRGSHCGYGRPVPASSNLLLERPYALSAVRTAGFLLPISRTRPARATIPDRQETEVTPTPSTRFGFSSLRTFLARSEVDRSFELPLARLELRGRPLSLNRLFSKPIPGHLHATRHYRAMIYKLYHRAATGHYSASSEAAGGFRRSLNLGL